MTELDIQIRKEEIIEKIKIRNIVNITPVDIDSILEFESIMTNNKDMVLELNEQGIIEDSHLEGMISKCFDVFLIKVSTEFGEGFCQGVYDYLPGEDIGFLDQKGERQ